MGNECEFFFEIIAAFVLVSYNPQCLLDEACMGGADARVLRWGLT